MNAEGKKKGSIHQPPVLERLVDLIERNAAELTNNWMSEIRKDVLVPTYQRFDEMELYSRAFRVYSQLHKWISRETTKDDIARDYIALGASRQKEGFALSEVIRALILIRRTLWRKIMDEGLLDTTYELYQAIELNDRVTLFFDRAIFYTAVGYERGI
jgi:hypothetical protein